MRAVEPLIAALKDADGKLREEAADALGQINDVRAVEPLIAVVKDKKNAALSNAAAALGKIKDRRAVEPLIAVLNDKEEHGPVQRCRGAGQAQGRASGRAADRGREGQGIAGRLGAGNRGGRGRSLKFMMPGRSSRWCLCWTSTACLACSRPRQRRWKNSTFRKREWPKSAPRAVEPLIAAMKDGKDQDRERAARKLGEIKDARAVEALIGTLSEKYLLFDDAAWALGQIGDPRAVGPLIAALRDKKQRVP